MSPAVDGDTWHYVTLHVWSRWGLESIGMEVADGGGGGFPGFMRKSERKRGTLSPPRKILISIDPGNTSAGVAYFVDGTYAASQTVNPWDGPLTAPECLLEVLAHAEGTKIAVFVEVPQNGTHDSRGGVHWAAGMVVASLPVRIKRHWVTKVKPLQWRRGSGLPVDLSKERSVELAESLSGRKVDSHDEAEAILIGAYGCTELGLR